VGSIPHFILPDLSSLNQAGSHAIALPVAANMKYKITILIPLLAVGVVAFALLAGDQLIRVLSPL
jgi:hypothetical protein